MRAPCLGQGFEDQPGGFEEVVGGREKEGLGSLKWARCQAFCCRTAGAWGEPVRSCTLCPAEGSLTLFFLSHMRAPWCAHTIPSSPTKTSGFLTHLLNILCLLGSGVWAEPGFFSFTSTLALKFVRGGLRWPTSKETGWTPCLPHGPTSKPHSPAFPGMVTTTMP